MAKGIPKTNAARLLDKAGIAYDLIPYTVDESDLGAVHVAELLGEDISTVYKTIVFSGDKTGYLVCVIPGNREVDLKKVAKLSGNKKVEPLHMKELLPITGYIRGGCSPIGMKKKFPVYFQEDCLCLPYFYVSAGQRGLQFRINPKDLINNAEGLTGDLIQR